MNHYRVELEGYNNFLKEIRIQKRKKSELLNIIFKEQAKGKQSRASVIDPTIEGLIAMVEALGKEQDDLELVIEHLKGVIRDTLMTIDLTKKDPILRIQKHTMKNLVDDLIDAGYFENFK